MMTLEEAKQRAMGLEQRLQQIQQEQQQIVIELLRLQGAISVLEEQEATKERSASKSKT